MKVPLLVKKMKFIAVMILLSALFFCSCQKGEKSCGYKLDDLLKKYDTTKVVIVSYDKMTEVLDIGNPDGEKGIYKFDENNILRFYGYIIDSSNDYYFGIEYDSVGNKVNFPKSHIVRWFSQRQHADSVKIAFLLYGIGYSYSNIKILNNNESIHIPLFESRRFSNLLAGETVLDKAGTIYITGDFKDKCSGLQQSFKDSLTAGIE